MQDAADKESKPDILKDTIHNLVKSRHTGGLWLIDNESGLLDAYSLLYAKNHPSQGHRFLDFHRQMLHTMCIFRRKTIERLRHLRNHSSVHNLLLNTIFDEEPLFFELHKSISNTDFDIHFRKRIEEVYRWILRCSKNAGHPI